MSGVRILFSLGIRLFDASLLLVFDPKGRLSNAIEMHHGRLKCKYSGRALKILHAETLFLKWAENLRPGHYNLVYELCSVVWYAATVYTS